MSIEAMKLALEALEHAPGGCGFMWQLKADDAIKALRAALAQQPATGEPVAHGPKLWWVHEVDDPSSGAVWTHQPDDEDVARISRNSHIKHTAVRLVPETFAHPAPSAPDDVQIAGQALANIAFNLAQNTGQKIEKRWADSMREAYKAWDAAMLAAK